MGKHAHLDMKSIGERILRFRRREGMTHLELARRLNLSPAILAMAENGVLQGDGKDKLWLDRERIMDLSKKMKHAFSVSEEWLLYGEGDTEGKEALSAPSDEVTVFLPMTLCSADLKEILRWELLQMTCRGIPTADVPALHIHRLTLIAEIYKIYRFCAIRAGRVKLAQDTARQLNETLARFMEMCKPGR